VTIIAQWREAERQLFKCEPHSLEAARLRTEAARLKDEYQAHVERAVDEDGSEPTLSPAA